MAGFFFALLNLLHDAAEFGNIQTDVLADLRHIGAQFVNLVRRAFDEHLPAATGLFAHPVHPVGVKLVTAIGVDEFLAVDPRLIRQFHNGAVDLHDAAVDAVQLVDQRFDPVVVQVQFVHQQHDLGPQLLIGRLVNFAKAGIFVQRGRDAAVLHLRQFDVIVGNDVQRLENLRLQRSFHRGQGHVGLFVFVIIVIAGNRVAVGIQLGLGPFARFLRVGTAAGHNRFVPDLIPQLVAECRLKVDHIAQQNVLGQKFVAPDGDRLKGQRAFAQARDHGVAAGLDALGDGDLALAAQQFHAAHLAQVHAHRIVGAVQFFRRARTQRDFAGAFGRRQLGRAFALFVLGFFVLDDVDAHLGQHRHHVFDLLGTDLIGGQNVVQLVIGDVALFAGFGDHLLDGRLAHVERMTGIGIVGLGVVVCIFRGHRLLLFKHSCRESPLSDSANRESFTIRVIRPPV